MNRLLEIGFEVVGHWHFSSDELVFELTKHGTQQNVLYAFVSDGEVKYVGKTVQQLRKRMFGYQNPGTSQATNIRNNARIKGLMRDGHAVEIYALPDNGLLHYGRFHMNLAAGLEDSIISVLRPEWNGQPNDVVAQDVEPEPGQDVVIDSFAIVLQRTYFNTGFFNVPVAHSSSFGDDGQQIEIFCGDGAAPIMGSINRSANLNNTPRIMGGSQLRDWFQAHGFEMEPITIGVFSPTSIRVEAARDESASRAN